MDFTEKRDAEYSRNLSADVNGAHCGVPLRRSRLDANCGYPLVLGSYGVRSSPIERARTKRSAGSVMTFEVLAATHCTTEAIYSITLGR